MHRGDFVRALAKRRECQRFEAQVAILNCLYNIVEQRLSPNAPEWDGFAEITLDPTQPLFGTPEGERIVRDDIARFIGHTFPYFVAEYVQRE